VSKDYVFECFITVRNGVFHHVFMCRCTSRAAKMGPVPQKFPELIIANANNGKFTTCGFNCVSVRSRSMATTTIGH
jgi:hypothetical protein